MQEKSGAWPNGQTPLCLQSESFFKLFFCCTPRQSTLCLHEKCSFAGYNYFINKVDILQSAQQPLLLLSLHSLHFRLPLQ